MGFYDELYDELTIGGVLSTVQRQLQGRDKARHGMMSGDVKKDVENLISRIDSLDTVLQGAEFATKTEWAEKIAAIREKLGKVSDFLSKPLDYFNALDETWTFIKDVKATAKFTPGQDPLGEAKAYGKAMQSLGKVAARIPLLNIYASFLEEMGGVFAQTVANIVPHLRGTHQRVDDQVMRGGDPSIWAPL